MSDLEGNFLYGNRKCEEITGYRREELIGKNFLELNILSEKSLHKAVQLLQANIEGNSTGPDEIELISKEGRLIPVEINTSVVQRMGQRIVLAFVRDITDRKRTEEALRDSEEKYRSIFDNAPLGLLHFNKKGITTSCNDKFVEIIGSSREVLMGLNMLNLPDKHIVEAVKLALNGKPGYYDGEYRSITSNKATPMHALFRPITSEKGEVLGGVGIIEDITERKQAEEKIRQMAYHDSLTGLPNRKLFSDRLGIALAQAQRNQKEVGIAMLDLDHFKDVNDTLGHDIGDLLLQATAERLSAALRKGDTVARFGGDEFLLILPDLKVIEDAIQVARKIVDSFRKPFLIDTHQLVVTTSIGIAVYPHNGTDEGILLKNADIAMYQAKQAGGDRYQLCIKA
jgi:diguanylate cyclase (GGDEF)-like protein/PAS domain S-box-containing protein